MGLLVDLADKYAVTSNRESGLGRYDVLLEPLDKDREDGIILEFKVHDPEDGDRLQDSAYAALQQIAEKKYTSVLESKGILKERI